MGFGVDLRARSRKGRGGLRALLGKPDPRELGERLVRLARRVFKGQIVDATSKRVTLALHPAAAPVRIAVLPDGDLEIRGDTSRIGPGYHADILERLSPILDELEYTLEGYDADVQAQMAAWLADELRGGTRTIGMPADRSFRVDAPVLTAMGPRDAAWRDAVIAEPMRGADAFAWWERGAGHDMRSRALLSMWLEVPWREPLDDDERKVMGQVDVDLRAARKADRELALPYADWAELLDWLGSDDEHATRVRTRAKQHERTIAIGYRRHDMDVEVAGWSLVLGGGFVGRWDDDGERWWATDGDRVAELTTLTAPDEADSQRLLDVAPELHPVIDRFVDGTRRGRAEAYDDGDVHIVVGIVASAPHVAILTCKGEQADEAWALATWRSLHTG